MSGQEVEGVLHLLGLARRSGRLVSGDRAVLAACTAGQARLLLLAEDASPHTRRRFETAAERAGIPLRYLADRIRLGEALGQSPRAVVALTDAGFANAVLDRLSRRRRGRGRTETIQDRGQE